MTLGDTAAADGRGLFPGVAGTAVTGFSTLEAPLRDRGSSWAPADGAGVVFERAAIIALASRLRGQAAA